MQKSTLHKQRLLPIADDAQATAMRPEAVIPLVPKKAPASCGRAEVVEFLVTLFVQDL
jgi:hypothetical protein